MQFQAVEETLDHYGGQFLGRGGAVQVEQDLRFGESRRKPVPWLGGIQNAAAVGHQLSALIVDGNDQWSAEYPRPPVEADAELLGGSWLDSTDCQIRMRANRRRARQNQAAK